MSESFFLRKAYNDPSEKEARLARIEEMENQVFEQAAAVVHAMMGMREVKHDQVDPPEEWIELYGEKEARRRLEIAKGMWLPQSLAPAGFKYAVQAMSGIARGRNYRVKLTQNNLNVKISLPAPTSSTHSGPTVYEVRDLER